MLKKLPQYIEPLAGTRPYQLFWGDQALMQERPLVKLLEDYRSQAEGQTATHTTNLVHHKCPHLHLHHIAEMNKGAKAVIYLRTFLVARSGSILDCPKCPDRCQIFH